MWGREGRDPQKRNRSTKTKQKHNINLEVFTKTTQVLMRMTVTAHSFHKEVISQGNVCKDEVEKAKRL